MLYCILYWCCRGGKWNIVRSLWIMAKKKIGSGCQEIRRTFALRLELFRALKVALAAHKMFFRHILLLISDSSDEPQ